ncbi:MAG: 3'-5' exonuclease [Patescibacteria group bacterium]|nr:3'-5' exonuclease [Patescibacteria group bacterium]
MDFKKDLLIVDTELTGLDAEKHEIIQLAGILLDRKTLKEKASFASYVRPVKWSNRDPEAMKVNKLEFVRLKNAPVLKKVIRDFAKKFHPEKVLLTAYVGWVDKRFLLKAFEKTGTKWAYDYHYMDIWSLAYVSLAKKGQLKNAKEFAGFNMENLLKKYNISLPGSHHDALFDCRAEAEILRQVTKQL